MSEEKSKNTESTLSGMMFTSFIITYAAGAFRFEEYMPQTFIVFYRYAVLSICLLTWFGFSFLCGTKRKWQYEVFTLCFWLIPPLVIWLANEGPRVFRMSLIMYLISEFANVLVISPAALFGDAAGIGETPSIIIILVICALCFAGGVLIARKLGRHRN